MATDRDDLLHSVSSNMGQWRSTSTTPNNAFVSVISVSERQPIIFGLSLSPSQPHSSSPDDTVQFELLCIALRLSVRLSVCPSDCECDLMTEN